MVKAKRAKSLTARSIFDQLKSARGRRLVLSGLVKKSKKTTVIMFSPSVECRDWLSIPADLIESVLFIRNVVCKSHTHPFVHLVMKEPKTVEGKAFSEVAHVHREMISMTNRSSQPIGECKKPKKWRYDEARDEWFCA